MTFGEFNNYYFDLDDNTRKEKFKLIKKYLIDYIDTLADVDLFMADFGSILTTLECDDEFGTEGMKL